MRRQQGEVWVVGRVCMATMMDGADESSTNEKRRRNRREVLDVASIGIIVKLFDIRNWRNQYKNWI